MSEMSSYNPNQLRAAGAEVKERPKPTLEDFAAQADYISMTIASKNDHHEGMQKAHAEYVENEEDPQLKKFGKLLLLAPRAAHDQKILNELKARAGQLSPDEIKHKNRLRRQECVYNQFLEDMVIANEEAMPPKELENWLSRASGNDPVFAKSHVDGITGEIAGFKLLKKVPELRGLRHGNVDEDLIGNDFMFDETRRGIDAVDVKTGKSGQTLPVTYDKVPSRLLLSIDRKHLEPGKYQVSEKYEAGYINEIRKSI